MHISLRRINTKKGFSIAELLVAILILSMVSIVVAGGIPVARDAYYKITVSANAQVMLSTAISSLRNEIGTASAVYKNKSSGQMIVYRSGKNGNISRIFIGKNKNAQDAIMIQEYYDPDKSDKDQKTEPRSLVPEMDDLYVTVENPSWINRESPSENKVSFKGLIVKRNERENAPSVNKSTDLLVYGIGKVENYVSSSSTDGSGTSTGTSGGTGSGGGTGGAEGTGNATP